MTTSTVPVHPAPVAVHTPHPVEPGANRSERSGAAAGRGGRSVSRERERGAAEEAPGVPWGTDGHCFRTLLGTSAQAAADGAGDAPRGTWAAAGGAATEALVDQLAPRLQATAGEALEAVLHLPRLGRIAVSGRRAAGTGWCLDLRAESAAAYQQLQARTEDCESALADALQQPVQVRVQRAAEDRCQ